MNSNLKHRVFDIPQDILDNITKTLGGVANINVKGKDRANRLLKDRKVSYGQLKRIIHDLQNMDAVNEKQTYELYGGSKMLKWGSPFLNNERELIRDKKEISTNINKNTGLERKNRFLKKHKKKKDSVIPRINLSIKSNSEKSAVSSLLPTGLFEEIKRFKEIINY